MEEGCNTPNKQLANPCMTKWITFVVVCFSIRRLSEHTLRKLAIVAQEIWPAS